MKRKNKSVIKKNPEELKRMGETKWNPFTPGSHAVESQQKQRNKASRYS